MALRRRNPDTKSGPDNTPQERNPETPPLHILYVEDNDTNWLITDLALRKRYKLKRAACSEDAIKLLQEHSFDLIFMDIELQGSGLDGIELTKLLKQPSDDSPEGIEIPISAPVVFMTAYSGRYTRSELIALGGDELISKPVDFGKLQSLLIKLLRTRTEAATAERLRRTETESALEQATQELAFVESKLIQSDKMAVYGTLTASIIHELCSPINCIVGLLGPLDELLSTMRVAANKDDPNAEEFIQVFTRIVSLLRVSSTKMVQQTDTLRRGSRSSKEFQDGVDLETVLSEAVLVATGRLKFISFKVETTASPPALRCVPGQIGQVLLNLLVNAVDAVEQDNPKGKQEVRVRLTTVDHEDRRYLQLECHDNGPGVPREIQERIFEGFFTTKDAEHGTGLGLSICQSIIEEHAGTLSVSESSLLGGACFTVRLPAQDKP